MDEKVDNNEKKFENYKISDIIVQYVLDKILKKAIVEANKNKTDQLLNNFCIYNLLETINKSVQNIFISREIDPAKIKNNPQMYYDNNYSDNFPISEININQPKPSQLDRWKIYKIPTIKKMDFNLNRIEEDPNFQEDLLKSTKNILEPNKNTKIVEESKIKEKDDNIISKNQIVDLPIYPLEDSEKEIYNNNIIDKNEYYHFLDNNKNNNFLNDFLLEEEKKKKEINKKLKLLSIIKKIKKPKVKFEQSKNRNFNLDHNGEIIVVKGYKESGLQKDFVRVRAKPFDKTKNRIEKYYSSDKPSKVEKNIFLEEANKIKEKETIIGGSPFKIFSPETGVNIKEGINIKSGGNDFYQKFKKHDLSSFHNTVDNLKKESFLRSKILFRKGNVSDLSNNSISIINNANNSFLNPSSENINSNKTRISLPEIKPTIKNSNTKNKTQKLVDSYSSLLNDSYIKRKSNFSFFNEYNQLQYCNKMKASNSFKTIMLSKDENINDELSHQSLFQNIKNNNICKSCRKTNRKIINYSFMDIFNRSILKNTSWGSSFSNEFSNLDWINNSSYYFQKRFQLNDRLNNMMKLNKKRKIIKNMDQFLSKTNKSVESENVVLK